MPVDVRGRRDYMLLIWEILAACPARKADVLKKTSITPPLIMKYIQLLLDKGFIKEKPGISTRSKIYELTPKGEEFLGKLQQVIEMLDMGGREEF